MHPLACPQASCNSLRSEPVEHECIVVTASDGIDCRDSDLDVNGNSTAREVGDCAATTFKRVLCVVGKQLVIATPPVRRSFPSQPIRTLVSRR